MLLLTDWKEYRLEVAEADYWKHDEKMKTEWTERTRMIREFLEEMEDWTSRDGMENSDWEYINEVQRMVRSSLQFMKMKALTIL